VSGKKWNILSNVCGRYLVLIECFKEEASFVVDTFESGQLRPLQKIDDL